jgi:hypothetical protein
MVFYISCRIRQTIAWPNIPSFVLSCFFARTGFKNKLLNLFASMLLRTGRLPGKTEIMHRPNKDLNIEGEMPLELSKRATCQREKSGSLVRTAPVSRRIQRGGVRYV